MLILVFCFILGTRIFYTIRPKTIMHRPGTTFKGWIETFRNNNRSLTTNLEQYNFEYYDTFTQRLIR